MQNYFDKKVFFSAAQLNKFYLDAKSDIQISSSQHIIQVLNINSVKSKSLIQNIMSLASQIPS